MPCQEHRVRSIASGACLHKFELKVYAPIHILPLVMRIALDSYRSPVQQQRSNKNINQTFCGYRDGVFGIKVYFVQVRPPPSAFVLVARSTKLCHMTTHRFWRIGEIT